MGQAQPLVRGLACLALRKAELYMVDDFHVQTNGVGFGTHSYCVSNGQGMQVCQEEE